MKRELSCSLLAENIKCIKIFLSISKAVQAGNGKHTFHCSQQPGHLAGLWVIKLKIVYVMKKKKRTSSIFYIDFYGLADDK